MITCTGLNATPGSFIKISMPSEPKVAKPISKSGKQKDGRSAPGDGHASGSQTKRQNNNKCVLNLASAKF